MMNHVSFYLSQYNALFVQSLDFHITAFLCKKKPLKPPPKNFMKFPVKGSMQYVQRQLTDPFVRQRVVEGYRCRSVYKLKELDDKFQIFKPGMSVVDLGAAPGSWSQVAVERVIKSDQLENQGSHGQIVAIDIQRFSPLSNVIQLTGDFTHIEIQKNIVSILNGGQANVVLCDAAPNASGQKHQDHLLLLKLAFSAARFALKILKPHGTFICKVWDCPEVNEFKKQLQLHFKKVNRVKPTASRNDSAEHYVLCLGRL